MVEEGVDSSDVGPTDSWVKGLEIRYLEPMKIWRIVTQSQIKGDIDLLEGFGYKSSLMNWKPGILKMELRDKEQV